MKNLIFIILIIVLVVLFGTFPLSVIGFIFELFGKIFNFLARILDIFNINGILR